MIKKSLIAWMIFMLFSCKEQSKHNSTTSGSKLDLLYTNSVDYSGNYIDSNYHRRSEGYDWIAIIVKRVDTNSISISIRSRADKKKPTCTFDATAYKKDSNTYRTSVQEGMILFSFEKDALKIYSENPRKESVLFFYCSGGVSFAGHYTKINEALDQTQIDTTSFQSPKVTGE